MSIRATVSGARIADDGYTTSHPLATTRTALADDGGSLAAALSREPLILREGAVLLEEVGELSSLVAIEPAGEGDDERPLVLLDRSAHLAPREVDHLIDRIAPEGASLRIIESTDENDQVSKANAASDHHHPPQRQNRGGYTVGYNDPPSRKTARSTQLRTVLR